MRRCRPTPCGSAAGSTRTPGRPIRIDAPTGWTTAAGRAEGAVTRPTAQRTARSRVSPVRRAWSRARSGCSPPPRTPTPCGPGRCSSPRRRTSAGRRCSPRAAAVVTDVGAPLSHAAIVARELGVPAVVGCGNATTRLHTGDRVRVDGGRGTVEILDRTTPGMIITPGTRRS
ncbi:MAG: PEP-utilizing enzyme [Pseudonocardia sp.]